MHTIRYSMSIHVPDSSSNLFSVKVTQWVCPKWTFRYPLIISTDFEILTERKTSMVTLLDKLWESRRYLRLQLAGSEFQETIAPGDNIGIFPRNPERDVERLLAKLKKIPPKELVIKLKGSIYA